MPTFALLIQPSANGVYAEASAGLTRAELEVLSRSVLDGRLGGISEQVIGGVPYVTFAADEFGAGDAAFLANLSSGYALFQVERDLLRPVELRRMDRFDSDLITIGKYPGKTNEQFTKLLLNVTALSSRFAPDMLTRRLAVIDPLCGRGTALNQALTYGYDAAGLNTDQKDFDAYSAFIRAWLQRKRVKHHLTYNGPVRRTGKVAARRLTIDLAATKDEYKAGENQRLDVVCADTTKIAEFFRPGAFDVMVTDAPSGVQHGSRTTVKGPTRNPLDLLAAAIDGWVAMLRSGGALGMSWNTLVASRDEAARILARAGLEIFADGPYRQFLHRVDQAVTRDVLIALKP